MARHFVHVETTNGIVVNVKIPQFIVIMVVKEEDAKNVKKMVREEKVFVNMAFNQLNVFFVEALHFANMD